MSECIMKESGGNGGYRVPGTRGKGRAQLYRGDGLEGLSGVPSPGSGAFPVVLPPGDGAAALSRTAGSSSMRLSRG